MALNPELLEILVCPETKMKISPADSSLIERLNREIETGSLKNKAGEKIEQKMDSGLIREDGKVLYPVRDDIPVLLIDEGIKIDG